MNKVPSDYRQLKGLGFKLTEDNAMTRGRFKVWAEDIHVFPRRYVVAIYQLLPNPKNRYPWFIGWTYKPVARGLTWHEMTAKVRELLTEAKVRGRLDDWWHRPAVRTVSR